MDKLDFQQASYDLLDAVEQSVNKKNTDNFNFTADDAVVIEKFLEDFARDILKFSGEY